MGIFIKTIDPAFKMDDILFDVNRYVETDSKVIAPHGHSYIEILIGLDGECQHTVNGAMSSFRCGDVFVMHPGWIHELTISSYFEHVTVACTRQAPGVIAPELKDHDNFKKLFDICHAIPTCLSLTHAEFHIINELTLAMLSEFATKRMGWQPLMRANFSAMIAQLCRVQVRQDVNAAIMTRLENTVAFMNANFRKEIKLSFLARKVGMSECHLTRLFHKAYGDSPINYLIKLRIEHARKLLLLTGRDLSITEVAWESGFRDSNYFVRQFKKNTGFSPFQYRRYN